MSSYDPLFGIMRKGRIKLDKPVNAGALATALADARWQALGVDLSAGGY